MMSLCKKSRSADRHFLQRVLEALGKCSSNWCTESLIAIKCISLLRFYHIWWSSGAESSGIGMNDGITSVGIIDPSNTDRCSGLAAIVFSETGWITIGMILIRAGPKCVRQIRKSHSQGFRNDPKSIIRYTGRIGIRTIFSHVGIISPPSFFLCRFFCFSLC